MSSKVGIVTGGARGIGADMANRLGKMGYDVVVNYVGSKDKAEEVVNEIKNSYGVDAFAIQGDVASYEDCQRMADAVMERYGRVDVLVSNAGIAEDGHFLDKTPELYTRIINVHLLGAMNMCHVFMPLLIKQEESCVIINSSAGALFPSPMQTEYGAAKQGQIAFARSMAADLAQYNCRVNCIAPGIIMSDLTTKSGLSEEKIIELSAETLGRNIPIKRMGRASEISDGMEYLINAKFVTGFCLSINGGISMS